MFAVLNFRLTSGSSDFKTASAELEANQLHKLHFAFPIQLYQVSRWYSSASHCSFSSAAHFVHSLLGVNLFGTIYFAEKLESFQSLC